MPLQRWFREHGKPGWYSWLAVAGTSLLSSIMAVGVAVHATESQVRAERAARVAAQVEAAKSREDGRRVTCILVVAQDDAFHDTEARPQTAAGKRAADAWRELRTAFRCDQE
jgi:CHASE1-domain containing sensor protein